MQADGGPLPPVCLCSICAFVLLVKHHPDALDMFPQFCMGDLAKNREVDLVGQQQVVKFLDDGAKFRRGQGLAVQGQVNVRAGLVSARRGSRTKQLSRWLESG